MQVCGDRGTVKFSEVLEKIFRQERSGCRAGSEYNQHGAWQRSWPRKADLLASPLVGVLDTELALAALQASFLLRGDAALGSPEKKEEDPVGLPPGDYGLCLFMLKVLGFAVLSLTPAFLRRLYQF